MNALLLALIPALSGIIAAVGTILVARWQQEGQQQVFMTQKIDEMVDERVAEIRLDRDEVKAQVKIGEKERKRLFAEIVQLKESNGLLKAQISEIQLHREQAINRMRLELSTLHEKNTVLLAENTELHIQTDLLRKENQELRQKLNV